MSNTQDAIQKLVALKQNKQNNLPEFSVTQKDRISSTTSKGNQTKWCTIENDAQVYIKARFRYDDKIWKDDFVEVIASKLCKTLGFYAIDYARCVLLEDNRKEFYGCYSINFLLDNEEFITYKKLLTVYLVQADVGYDEYISKTYKKQSAEQRFQLCLDVYSTVCKLNIGRYLAQLVVIDYLVLNEDRHMNNYGVIRNNVTGEFRIAPLFDFGLGLFEHDLIYQSASYTSAIRKVKSRFCSSSFTRLLPVALSIIPNLRIDDITIGMRDKLEYPNVLARIHLNNAIAEIRQGLGGGI